MGIPRLRLFGVPRLEDESGLELRLRTKKQLGLLVYLTLEGRYRPVSRAYLVDLLWPDASPENARHSLAQALSAIRSRLGSNALTRGGEIVQLFGGLETDLDHIDERFADLDVARPLEHLELWAGADFAHWVDGARRRCVQIAVEQLREAVHRLRAEGATAQVYECAAKLYQLDPLSDVAVLVLAEASLVRGDVVGAIQLLRDHVHRYQDTVNCNPPRDVERLLRRLEAGAHPPIEAVPPRLAREARTIRPKVFVGRQREMARLEAEWEQVRAGRSRSCHIVGPGGIGKSSLIRRFATRLAARAHPVFVVSCQEIGQGIPFAATADLITTLCRDPSLSGTDPQWLAEASRVQPALRAAYPGIPDPPPAPPESIRIRVAEGLLHMIEAVGDGGPAAVFFDDVQYMDPASREVLFVLRRRLSDIPVLLVGTVRAGELDAEPSTSGAARSRMQWDEVIPLTPLDAETTEGLIDRLSDSLDVGNDSIRQKIVQLSEGNPYFVEMLVADWERHAAASLAASEAVGRRPAQDWRPPDNLRLAFARLYEGLDEHAQQMLHVLAVAGRGLAVEEMANRIGLNRPQADVAILDLIQRGILRLDAGALHYKNNIHRAYAYYAMPPDARKYHHLRVAEEMSRAPGEHDFQLKLEIGFHSLQAGIRREALATINAAAKEAITRGAPVEADRALESVLALSDLKDDAPVQLSLASARVAQGKYPAALALLSGVDLSGVAGNELARARTLAAECLHRGQLSDCSTVQRAADEALAASHGATDADVLVSSLQIAAEVAAELGAFDRLRDVEERCEQVVQRTTSDLAKALCNKTLGYCGLVQGHYEAATRGFLESSHILRDLMADGYLNRVMNGLGIAYTSTGDQARAREAFHEALQLASRSCDRGYEAVTWANLGALHHDFGNFSDAATCCERSLRQCDDMANARLSAFVCWIAAALAMDLGDFGQADELLRRAESVTLDCHVLRDRQDVFLVRADYHLALGEPECAWPFVERVAGPQSDRQYMLGEAGRHERLRRHYVYATRGYTAFTEFSEARDDRTRRMPLAARLEVSAFDAWVRNREGSGTKDPLNSLDEILGCGMLGILAHLTTVHCCPGFDPGGPSSVSSAQLVAERFPGRVRGQIPRPVCWTR
jgi:DNA-binding SARP family transcriptional activator/tetratricopeptide (TPR) repeat protein